MKRTFIATQADRCPPTITGWCIRAYKVTTVVKQTFVCNRYAPYKQYVQLLYLQSEISQLIVLDSVQNFQLCQFFTNTMCIDVLKDTSCYFISIAVLNSNTVLQRPITRFIQEIDLYSKSWCTLLGRQFKFSVQDWKISGSWTTSWTCFYSKTMFQVLLRCLVSASSLFSRVLYSVTAG